MYLIGNDLREQRSEPRSVDAAHVPPFPAIPTPATGRSRFHPWIRVSFRGAFLPF